MVEKGTHLVIFDVGTTAVKTIIFDERVKGRCEEIFQETAGRHGMAIREIGFDRDHVHITVDAGPNHSPASMAKILKGNSGYRLLREFPYLKGRYFWGSGLWNPA